MIRDFIMEFFSSAIRSIIAIGVPFLLALLWKHISDRTGR